MFDCCSDTRNSPCVVCAERQVQIRSPSEYPGYLRPRWTRLKERRVVRHVKLIQRGVIQLSNQPHSSSFMEVQHRNIPDLWVCAAVSGPVAACTLSPFVPARSECHLSSLLTCEVKVNKSSPLPQFFETVIRFLAEGAASGLNVIAVYVAEILRVTGFDGGYQGIAEAECLHVLIFPPFVCKMCKESFMCE